MTSEVSALEGLRARKKRRTRTEISDVATRLFAQRGFEEVTLAEIATAADVSVKTILNYFGSKEELYFDRADELRDALLDAFVKRPPGTTVLAALRRLLVDNLVPFAGHGWDGIGAPEGFERFRAFLATEERSPALRARRMVIGAELGDTLGAALARELGRPPADDAARALSTFLAGVLHLRDGVLRAAVLAREPVEEIRGRVTRAVDEAFDRLEGGFADVDRPAR